MNQYGNYAANECDRHARLSVADMRSLTSLLLILEFYSGTCVSRDVRFGYKMGQILADSWDVLFGPKVGQVDNKSEKTLNSQNVMKTDPRNPSLSRTLTPLLMINILL